MKCSLSFHIPKALPSLSPSKIHHPSFISSSHKQPQACTSTNQTKTHDSRSKFLGLAVQVGGVLSTVLLAEPALAVTGVNDEDDLVWTLIQLGISAFLYFIVAPPIIMNWLRIRWYRRNLLEMYVQFMFVFIFYPGILIWAPFLNFRKFPRDPSMKYPWSIPETRLRLRVDSPNIHGPNPRTMNRNAGPVLSCIPNFITLHYIT